MKADEIQPGPDFTFAEYQAVSKQRARMEDEGDPLHFFKMVMNRTLGLAGEAGEVADICKKHFFHDKPLDREALKKELGDCLWYLAMLGDTLDIPLVDIAQTNVAKLRARFSEGWSPQAANARADEKGGE